MAVDSVERVAVPVATRWPDGRTNAYVVGETDALLVDPPAVTAELTDVVDARDVAHIAVTHAHRDHAGAVDHYAERCDATVWARAGREHRFGRVARTAPNRTFREGTAVGPATVLETPGHAPDHVAFRVGDVALVGDLAVAEGSVFVGGEDGDMRAYLVSLRRLYHADLGRLYPGHGGVVEAPRATLERLLAHRRDRERQVLGAVESGARALEAVTDAAYAKDLTGVVDLARLTVAAHLEKLAAEGRVRWDGERAAPV